MFKNIFSAVDYDDISCKNPMYYCFYSDIIQNYITIYAIDDYIVKIDFKKKLNIYELDCSKELSICKSQLEEYFSCKRQEFDFKYKLFCKSKFQQSVLQEVSKIEYGKYTSYKDIAINIGNIKATRAVGTAIGKNPLPIVLPCHRVLRSNKTIGGYAGGLELKRKLLFIENIAILT